MSDEKRTVTVEQVGAFGKYRITRDANGDPVEAALVTEPDARTQALWMGFRQGLLAVVDAIEVYLNMPRTSDLRKAKR